MKLNKFMFLFFSLLVVLLVSCSFIYTNAFTVDYNENINGNIPSVYNDDYELNLSLKQPLVANYYYTDVQGAYNTTYSPYLYQYGVSNTVLTNGSLHFDAYDDVSFFNDTLFNELIILKSGSNMGIGNWGIGLSGPLYVKLSEINQFINSQYLQFDGISETQFTYCNFSFSYHIMPTTDDGLQIASFVYNDHLLPSNQSLYTDDKLHWFPLDLILSSFEQKSPYYLDPVIKIDYIYTYFDIGFDLSETSYNYYLNYIFPVITVDKAEDVLINNVFEFNSLSFGIGSNPSEFNIGDFIYDSVTSVLNIEILPNFSFINLLLICLAIPLLIYILKLFLGG